MICNVVGLHVSWLRIWKHVSRRRSYDSVFLCYVQGKRCQQRTKFNACRGKARGVEEEVRQEPAEESDLSGTNSESEADGEEVVWGRSGVNAESYKRKMVI